VSTFPSYAEFIDAHSGYSPYMWQEELADLLYGGEPPARIDVEAGMGKSSVVDAWLWVFAKQRREILDGTRDPDGRTVPMRLHFVVDRRVIVDEVHDRAVRIRRALADAAPGTELAAVARSFTENRPPRFTGDDAESPFDVVVLRGGMPVRAEHSRYPHIPTVVTSTVDLFGSRLLFRGYGVSWQRRPIDAALTGADTLVVIDEAHLANQLLTTLHVLDEEYPSRGLDGVLRRHVTTMSATSVEEPLGRSLRMDVAAEIRSKPELQSRIERRDAVSVTVAEPVTKGQLAATLAERALSFFPDGPHPGRSVCVFVNTPDDARATTAALRSRLGKLARKKGSAWDGAPDVVMLHGRLDGVSKRLAVRRLAGVKTNAEHRETAPPFVVATQTLEVGADLDFDAVITAECSLDAFVQRAGRCNRLGLRPEGAVVVVPKTQKEEDDQKTSEGQEGEPVESGEAGEPAEAQEDGAGEPVEEAAAEDKKSKTPKKSLGLYAERAIYTNQLLAECSDMGAVRARYRAAAEHPPAQDPIRRPAIPLILDRVTFDDYLTTTPQRWEAPVEPWLRDDAASASVNIVRRQMDVLPDSVWSEYLTIVRPMPWETAAVPWFDADKIAAGTAKPVVIRQGTSQILAGDVCLLPGDVLVLPADDEHPDLHECDPCYEDVTPEDAGEDDVPGHPGCLVITPEDSAFAMLAAMTEPGVNGTQPCPKDAADVLAHLAIEPEEGADDLTRTIMNARCALVARVCAALTEDQPTESISLAPLHNDDEEPVAIIVKVFQTLQDERMRTHRPLLADHNRDVAKKASAWAEEVGLSQGDVSVLEEAGRRHDDGKDIDFFQRRLLWNHATGDFDTADAPVAKSLGGLSGSRVERWRQITTADRMAGFRPGFRHEALSAARYEAGCQAGDDTLVRHLVGTHHGYGRGLMPVMEGTESPLQDPTSPQWSEWPEQFRRLNAAVGPYRLAFLEAVLRLADWECSREDVEAETQPGEETL